MLKILVKTVMWATLLELAFEAYTSRKRERQRERRRRRIMQQNQ